MLYQDSLLIYSITNNEFRNIIDDFITVSQKNDTNSFLFLYIDSFSDTIYVITLYMSEQLTKNNSDILYKHTKYHQFFIACKSYFIPVYWAKYPKDNSIIEIPFLYKTNKKLCVLLQDPPTGYYDTTFLGEYVLEKLIMSWSYEYDDGIFKNKFDIFWKGWNENK
jgi:hypothetical protein